MMRSFDPDLKLSAIRQVSSPSSYREMACQSTSRWNILAISGESLEPLSQPMLRHGDSGNSDSGNSWKPPTSTGWREADVIPVSPRPDVSPQKANPQNPNSQNPGSLDASDLRQTVDSAEPSVLLPEQNPVDQNQTGQNQVGQNQTGQNQPEQTHYNQPEPAEPGPDKPESGDLDEPERGLLPVLRNRNFLALWSGQVFSQIADKVYLVLMIALIETRFQSEGQAISGWVSTLMIAFTIPAVLFGSVAGVFVDHWHKRAVLVTTNLLRGGLVLGLPLWLWLSQGWSTAGQPVGFLVVLGITFLVSTLTQFFAPAEQAVIPLIVERRHLLSANSLYTMTMMASVIIGFALGEPLLALADQLFLPLVSQFHLSGDVGRNWVVGGSYALAGLLLMSLNTHEKKVNPHEELPDVWQNILEGLRYLGKQSQVRAALIAQVILFSIFAALAVLAVRLAEVMPELKSSQFGFLLAAGGVGMAIGAILVGQFGQRFSRAQLSLYGSIGIAAALAAISFFTHHLFPTLPLLVLLGSCAAIAGVPMQTAIQEETPEAMRGKVFGLQNNAINIALSLPLALAGMAETWFGLQAVFLALAVLATAGGILTWSISRGHNPVK
ncbi:MAG: MFS transporter [Elainella sp.]